MNRSGAQQPGAISLQPGTASAAHGMICTAQWRRSRQQDSRREAERECDLSIVRSPSGRRRNAQNDFFR
eukprot:scaffold120156_cov46-Prasinocladus_malaysianus.AAC.1